MVSDLGSPSSVSTGLNYIPSAAIAVRQSSSRSNTLRGDDGDSIQSYQLAGSSGKCPSFGSIGSGSGRFRKPSSSLKHALQQPQVESSPNRLQPSPIPLACSSVSSQTRQCDRIVSSSSPLPLAESGSFRRNLSSPTLVSLASDVSDANKSSMTKSRPLTSSSPIPVSIASFTYGWSGKKIPDSPQQGSKLSGPSSSSIFTRIPSNSDLTAMMMDVAVSTFPDTTVEPDSSVHSQPDSSRPRRLSLTEVSRMSSILADFVPSEDDVLSGLNVEDGIFNMDFEYDVSDQVRRSEDQSTSLNRSGPPSPDSYRRKRKGDLSLRDAFSPVDRVNIRATSPRLGSMVMPLPLLVRKPPQTAPEDVLFASAQAKYPSLCTPAVVHAFEVAKEAHAGQLRKSGDPYVSHCIETAAILAEMNLGDNVIMAALLHDTLDDSHISVEYLRSEFGREIADLVSGVSRLSAVSDVMRPRHRSLDKQEVDTLGRMLLSMIKDSRVILIKMADRLHNMRTIHFLPRESQIRLAKDTLETYVPLANRLGIWLMKGELEDLCFQVLHPDDACKLKKDLEEDLESFAFLSGTMKTLKQEISVKGIDAEIAGRSKTAYGIWKKMQNKGRELNDIYDVRAIRVIVDTVEDCYSVLDTVHSMWKPVGGELNDYIKNPKNNNYQSLHTAVYSDDDDRVFEVQIRTKEMHRIAEFGCAAHWMYKEQRDHDSYLHDKIRWLRTMLDWRQEIIRGAEGETFGPGIILPPTVPVQHSVVVITGHGELLELPAGSSVGDAVAAMGKSSLPYYSATLNDRPVDFATRVQDGDHVQVVGGSIFGLNSPRSPLRVLERELFASESEKAAASSLECAVLY
mmetsp:Transcript_44726/g.72815  ORF Transcript_44726/g.72815 Transcript_44726/m.72815 type:complete len:851 (-) Transcript_44726:326-2878(-)